MTGVNSIATVCVQGFKSDVQCWRDEFPTLYSLDGKQLVTKQAETPFS